MRSREIRSEVFLRHDIQSILSGIYLANLELTRWTPQAETATYRAGFEAAIRAVATAFHVGPLSHPLEREASIESSFIDAEPHSFRTATSIPLDGDQAFPLRTE
jgi:hypothetical protein